MELAKRGVKVWVKPLMPSGSAIPLTRNWRFPWSPRTCTCPKESCTTPGAWRSTWFERRVLPLRQLLDRLLVEVVDAAADGREDVVPRPIEALGYDDDVLRLLHLERECDGGLFRGADHGFGGRDLQPLLPCDQRVGARGDRWGDEVTRRVALGPRDDVAVGCLDADEGSCHGLPRSVLRRAGYLVPSRSRFLGGSERRRSEVQQRGCQQQTRAMSAHGRDPFLGIGRRLGERSAGPAAVNRYGSRYGRSIARSSDRCGRASPGRRGEHGRAPREPWRTDDGLGDALRVI